VVKRVKTKNDPQMGTNDPQIDTNGYANRHK